MTAIEYLIVALLLVGAWTFMASMLCCSFADEQEHWWCPICLLFGKRRLP